MARFEDSLDLFGRPVGTSPNYNFSCGICGKEYNKDGKDEDIGTTYFANVIVCEYCFEAIENEILGRMDDILPWFERMIEYKERRTKRDKELLDKVMSGLLNKVKNPENVLDTHRECLRCSTIYDPKTLPPESALTCPNCGSITTPT